MPRRQEPKKDAGSCEKLRGSAFDCRSVDIGMGKPAQEKLEHQWLNKIGH